MSVKSRADAPRSTPQPRAVPVGDLKRPPWYARTASEERLANLQRSLEADPEFLWHRPILADAAGLIYAGVLRYEAAVALGHETVPAILEDLPDRLAKERSLRDNQHWGQWADDQLAVLLRGLEGDASDLELLGFDDHEVHRLLDLLDNGPLLDDPEAVPALPPTPVTKTGDLYLLGEHRLLCGDATKPADISSLMGGKAAACLWTDPPYGVGYQGKTAAKLTIANDATEGLERLLTDAFAAIDAALQPGAALYIAHAAGPSSLTFGSCFVAQGWQLRQTLVWVKNSLVLGHGDYHFRHEPFLFGYKRGGGRRGRGGRGWYGGNAADTVFEVPRPHASPDHPTAKPVELVTRMLRNSTRRGDVVLDPFLGSGSTLIAAGQLGRICFGIELDPRYVDVAVERWERVTGQRAKRVRGRKRGKVAAP